MLLDVKYDKEVDNIILNEEVVIVGFDEFLKGNYNLLFDQSIITNEEATDLVNDFASELFNSLRNDQ